MRYCRLLSIVLVALLAPSVWADDASSATPSESQVVKDTAVRQAQIRAEVERAQVQLSSIIDEFGRNGMGDAPDVKVLESVRDSVVKLSDEQMAQVLEVLDRAGRADPGDAARSDLTIAYGSQ